VHERAAVQIHLVTDRRRLCPGEHAWPVVLGALERQAAEAAEAGVSVVQLRERDLAAGELMRLAETLQRRVTGSGTTIIINDRSDVALAAGVGGVHLRGDGPPVSRVRTLGPASWVVGRSVHSVFDVRAHQDADYLIFGTMFSSRSKPGVEGQGPDQLASAVQASRVPVIAIGGLSFARAEACARVGAAGVAAIGLFLPAGLEPEARGVDHAVREVRAAFDRGRSGHVQ
jgi:thiamine-phosphate pyrophosphorylase